MAAVNGSVDIHRPPQQVFDYVADVKRRPDWQEAVERIVIESNGAGPRLPRVHETRRVTGGPRTYTFEVTEQAPPERWAFRGLDGPVRPVGVMTVAAAGAGASRVSIDIDFRGIWPLTAFARRDARTQVPRDLAQLKSRLEQEAVRA